MLSLHKCKSCVRASSREPRSATKGKGKEASILSAGNVEVLLAWSHNTTWSYLHALSVPAASQERPCLQMVDRLDQGAIPAQVVAQSYEALWKLVSKALYRTHVEGQAEGVPPQPCERLMSCHLPV